MDKTKFDLFYQSTGICTDTRKITPNCLFICIKGDNFDGNKFASKAIELGASHVIIDNPEYLIETAKMTLVEDSVHYLQKLANFHRKKFDIPVIGITGSNGKTTTRELINAVLSRKYNTLATIGNLNNHLGVPFTLLRLNKQHEIAIIEMGANRFKDIEELCAIAEPDFGVITNIGKAHLEGFIDFEGVLRTKRELYQAVENKSGLIVINGDDEILTSALPLRVNTFAYGTSEKLDVSGELIELTPFVSMKWTSKNYTSPPLTTRMIGKYNFYNYLCAAAFGVKFGVDNDEISQAIQSYEPDNNRSQVKHTGRNTIILDCYNANPTSMKSALESFAENNTNKEKLIVIGEMKELGAESKEEHNKIVTLVEKLNLSGYFIGEGFAHIESQNILNHFDSAAQLKEKLNLKELKEHLILLKGSRSVKLEDLENEL